MHAYIDTVFDTQHPLPIQETLLNLYLANRRNDDAISVFISTVIYVFFVLVFLIIETALHFLYACLRQPGRRCQFFFITYTFLGSLHSGFSILSFQLDLFFFVMIEQPPSKQNRSRYSY